MVPGLSNRLWDGWEALYGVYWVWQGDLIRRGHRFVEELIYGLVRGLYQWLVVCGVGLASIRA